MNEKEKMIAGMNYNPLDPQLILLRDPGFPALSSL